MPHMLLVIKSIAWSTGESGLFVTQISCGTGGYRLLRQYFVWHESDWGSGGLESLYYERYVGVFFNIKIPPFVKLLHKIWW